MKEISGASASKIRALREAQKLGCGGAHRAANGQWMPCSSHEKLRDVSPALAQRNGTTIDVNRAKRTHKGPNKIKKQWENLGERGIVAIGNISTGGLVSGVTAKMIPGSPGDQDPDVFTDISSARKRAQQLGCIGVSRRISRSGNVVWMPCTNMSDYASRAGTTYLGRRHQRERMERFISETVSKKKPGKKTMTLTGVEFKSLGPKVGSGIGGGLRAAPDGFSFVDITGVTDADSDGIVFEGKQGLERPIIPRFIVPSSLARRLSAAIEQDAVATEKRRRLGIQVGGIDDSTLGGVLARLGIRREELRDINQTETLSQQQGLASRRIGRIDFDSAIERSTSSGDTAFSEFSPSRKAKKKARQTLKDFISTLTPPDDSNLHKSDDEVLEIISNSFPESEEQLKEILQNNSFTKKMWKDTFKRISSASFDPGSTAALKKLFVEQAKNNEPLLEMVRRYGMPPIVVTEQMPPLSWISVFGQRWGSVGGAWSPLGIIAINPMESFSPRKVQVHNINHELAHSWETMSALVNESSREHFALSYAEIYEGLLQIAKTKDGKYADLSYQDAKWGTQEEHDSAKKISDYATTARVEWFAESIASLLSDDENTRARVDRTARQNIAEVLGVGQWEVEQIFRPYGMRSSSATIGSRGLDTSELFRASIGIDSGIHEETVEWVNDNPGFLGDVPISVFMLTAPNTRDEYRRMQIDAQYGMRSSGTVGSGGREMGRKILARVNPQHHAQQNPTYHHVGGTTGAGKSTLVKNGDMVGLPPATDAAHIDPDEIKTGLVGWNNGRGAGAVHEASRQATDRIMSDAADAGMHIVTQGTGKRREHLIQMKKRGYSTVGHFVWVPDDEANTRLRQRKLSGGANIPDYFGSLIASELRGGPSAVSRQITDGLYDEFFLYDNSSTPPRVVARLLRDGTVDISDRKVFDSFFSPTGAKFVINYWNSKKRNLGATGVASRGVKNIPPEVRGSRLPGMKSFRGFTKDNPLRDSELPKVGLYSASMKGVVFMPNSHFVMPDANFADMRFTNGDRSVFSGSNLLGADLSNSSFINADFSSSFKGKTDLRFVNFQRSRLNGVKFSGTDLRSADFGNSSLMKVDFQNSILDGASFDGADLSGANLLGSTITASQLQNAIFDQSTILPDGLFVEPSTNIDYSPRAMHMIPPDADVSDDFFEYSKYLESGKIIINGDVSLSGLRVRRRDLSRSNIQNSNVSDSDFVDVVAVNSQFKNLDARRINGENARFDNSVIETVDMSGSNLKNSSFARATISGNSSFRNTDLRGANFSRAIIGDGVDLRGADFTGARLSGVDLRKAIVDTTTKLSKSIGLNPDMAPRSLYRNDRTTSLTADDLDIMDTRSIIGIANDALVTLGDKKTSALARDIAISDIAGIAEYVNTTPMRAKNLRSHINSTASRLASLDAEIAKYMTLKNSDGSEISLSTVFDNLDYKSYRAMALRAQPGRSLTDIRASWQKARDLMARKESENLRLSDLMDESIDIRSMYGSIFAFESMLLGSDEIGVSPRSRNVPKPSARRRPSVSIGDISDKEIADINRGINAPMIIDRKSRRVENAMKRLSGLASRSRPQSDISKNKRAEDIYKTVTEALIAALEEADSGNWERPWNLGMSIPRNPMTGQQYKGFNVVFLALIQQHRGYKYPLWGGYGQWQKIGGQVRKGEKGTVGIYAGRRQIRQMKDGVEEIKFIPFSRSFTVFNADQVDGIDPESMMPPRLSETERLQALDDTLREIIPGGIVEALGEMAYYSPSEDKIHVPPFSQFKNREHYYATVAHELIHWTGHGSRENRANMGRFGTPEYAFEELVAEIGSAFLMSIFGIEAVPQPNHAQYIKSWIRLLKDDPDAIQKASKLAENAVNRLIAMSPRLQELSKPPIALISDDEDGVTADEMAESALLSASGGAE